MGSQQRRDLRRPPSPARLPLPTLSSASLPPSLPPSSLFPSFPSLAFPCLPSLLRSPTPYSTPPTPHPPGRGEASPRRVLLLGPTKTKDEVGSKEESNQMHMMMEKLMKLRVRIERKRPAKPMERHARRKKARVTEGETEREKEKRKRGGTGQNQTSHNATKLRSPGKE
ncbi:hypothetical protein Mapa_017584 [Marchantia paleacea]|nr:hypothetical protein Mapa_017584 [Marchantia paleacea]